MNIKLQSAMQVAAVVILGWVAVVSVDAALPPAPGAQDRGAVKAASQVAPESSQEQRDMTYN